MKVSLKWLKTMVEVPSDLAAFARRLDLTGTAVDEVLQTGAVLEGVVVGHILTRERHPNADTLWLTTVDVGPHNLGEDGRPEPLQIVCGAQNFVAGNKVPVALTGTTLPDGTTIKKSKLRGVESRGMNCSARELGLGDEHEGILLLPEDAPVGAAVSDYLGISDTVFDLEITPNRPDCMSMFGVAREIAAVYDTTFELGRELPEPPVEGEAKDLVRVSIDEPSRCPRYTAHLIRGVKIGPSPLWLAERVTAAGTRSINNIVDVTNYIMYETGQPLHAFDFDTLTRDEEGRVSIVVRAAGADEQFTTLDEIERRLTPDVTVIVDGNAAAAAGVTVALAGVMGGLASEVTENTVNILLESAAFDPGHTSRTSRNLKLFSESSSRFERGVDDASCETFGARAAALMVEVGGGSVAEGVLDCYPAPREIPVLSLSMPRLRSLIGAEIPDEDAVGILRRLGCTLESLGGGSYQVTPPSFRPDLEREIDLYEEVLRIWGMERVEPKLPRGEGRIGSRTPEQLKLDKLGFALRASGLNETMTYAFASREDTALLGMRAAEGREPVELINPINSEQTELRQTILPGLLRSVAYNQNHGVPHVQLYEIGGVFNTSEGRKQPRETQRLAGVLTGSWNQQGWNEEARGVDFFDAKGVLENLARELCIPRLRFVTLTADEAPWLARGQAAELRSGSAVLGWLGTVHPRSAAAFGAASPVVAFELDVAQLLRAAADAREFEPVPLYPAVTLDLALVVDGCVPAEKLVQVARSAGGALLADVRVFDVFVDADKLGAGRKSVALALSYRSPERTLTSEEVEKLHSRVVRKLEGATGGAVRST
ncbi:MAG: phenylalanine--tRNA ligase subunit beta [Coriobacteriales bacterium]|jgi:phenylalanyl-tRNA synthetase beta chain|nr:phenylalanine--tRNA ligase subunit beta [Coriobacteriales bacterium]